MFSELILFPDKVLIVFVENVGILQIITFIWRIFFYYRMENKSILYRIKQKSFVKTGKIVILLIN